MSSRVIAVILSLLASLVTPVANAQEHLEPVEGVVVDETGAAIPHVKLVFHAGSNTFVAYTDMNGVVRVMLAAGRYEVTISQFGFATTRLADFFVLRPNVDTFQIVLKIAATAIDPVVPTAVRVPTVVSELPNVIAAEHFSASVPMTQPARTRRRSIRCLYLRRCSTTQR